MNQQLMRDLLGSLQAYRRELNDGQPCDAEKALMLALNPPRYLTEQAIIDMCRGMGWDTSYRSMPAYRTIEKMSLELNVKD